MYIYDTRNASDGSYVDGSTSDCKQTGKVVAGRRSTLKGPALQFPSGYPKTLNRALQKAAKSTRSVIFVDDRGGEKEVTYKQLMQNAEQVLASLQQMGAAPGQAVILQLDSLDEFLTVFWACILGGLLPVPVLPFRNASLDDSSFNKLHTIASQLQSPFILMSEHNADSVARAQQDGDVLLPDVTVTTFAAVATCSTPAVLHNSKTQDIAFLQYTSGSTSFPKGTQITHANVLATVQSMIQALNVRPESVMVNWMPYYHDMGIIAGHIMAVVSACTVVAMKPFTFVRRPLLWLEKIHQHRATITFSPNFGLKRIIEKCKPAKLTHLDLSCLEVILNGAEPISIQTSQRFTDLLHTHCGMRKQALVAGYGLAEASLAVSIAPIDEGLRTHILNRDRLGCGDTVQHVHAEDSNATYFADEGPAVAGMEVRIVNDDDKVLPAGTVGHVQIRGRSVTQGYYANETANKEAFCGKWFRTGDLGFVYEGRFVITGRVKDVVFVNGQNYYSHDFEHACENIDGLERLVVIGHYDAERNEEDILAFVAFNSKFIGAREKTEILRAMQIRINQCFDVTPTMFVLLKSTGEIPKTTSGKIMRHKLLDHYIEGRFSNQCIHISELLEISPDLSTEPDSGKHVTIAEFKLLIRNWWSQVLGISENAIGDHDPFYSLGGTSIKAIEVLALAEETVDCVITHDMFKEHDTIHGLANYIVRENVTVRCKANRLVQLAPYREDRRNLDSDMQPAQEQVDIQPELNKSNNRAPEIREDDIAIIGMGCVFPQADNVDAFWEILKQGRDCVTEFPSNRCNINRYYEKTGDAPNTTVSKWGSFIEDHHFDPAFFSLNENEALTMDPHQRVFMNAAWQAIQDSGLTDIQGSNMGVFVGASGTGFYQQREDALITPATLTGALANLAAARVSNAFNLKGPSLSVDTACSSSLVSVDLAVKSILNGESDTAIAGGVQVIETVVIYLMFSRAGILSPEGRCFTFSDRANGFVPGEGAGAVVLKRYSEAVRDGDRVYAVIKASATNNDGASLGIMAPNPEGQEKIISNALQQAEVNPADIGYVEAHGTGTNIGDLIEVRSLSLAFNEKGELPRQSCAIGSVKTNMGHQLAAAGIAGLMKAALTIYKKEIPATLHCEQERKELKLAETPFYVNHKTRPWRQDENRPRLAAVNSFGFGGTNAHVILSSPYHAEVQYDTTTSDSEPLVYCLSAKSESALQAARHAFAGYASSIDGMVKPRDVAYSYAARRDHFRQNRVAVVAESLQHAARVMQGEKVKDACIIECKSMPPTRKRIAWLFSGQGSQHPGMGKTLYVHEPVFREIVDYCDEIAQPLLRCSLRELLLNSTDAQQIDATELTQPLVFVMDYALARLWQSWGVQPDFMLGHSIGEYVAACVAEVMSLEDCLTLVIKRGALMGSMPSGCGMTAVMATSDKLIKHVEVLDLPLDIAAYNGPSSTVLSGELDVLGILHERLDKQSILYQPLAVSHAFHSRHMEPMLDEFRRCVKEVNFEAPKMAVVSNVTGRLYDNACQTTDSDSESGYWADYWVNHIRQPVQFHKGMQTLVASGAKVFMEIGAQQHLSGLTRRIVNMDESLIASSQPKQADKMDVARHIVTSKASLYAHGVDIDWRAYYQRHGDRRNAYHQQRIKPAVERRGAARAAASSVKMVSVPACPMEKRSMFRLVGDYAYPFRKLFSALGDDAYRYQPDAASPLFSHHVVCKTPMMSAAGQCDIISHLHAQSFKLPPKSMRNISFHQPWLAGSEVTVRFEGKDEKRFVASDRRGKPILQGYASALTHGEVCDKAKLEELEKALDVRYEHDAVYEIFAACGVEYGELHRNIIELKATTTQAVARLRPAKASAADWQHGFYLHPGMLDSAFQATAGILLAQMQQDAAEQALPTMVPIGIEAINNYKCLQEAEYYVRVNLCDEAAECGSELVSCNVCVYDLSGDPCVSIKRLQLRRMPTVTDVRPAHSKAVASGEVSQSQNSNSEAITQAAEFFQTAWQPCALPEQVASSHVCLLLGSRYAVEQRIVDQLSEAGVSVLLVPYTHYSDADEEKMQAILGQVEQIDSIVSMMDYDPVETAGDAADMNGMRCMFSLLKAITKCARNNKSLKNVRLIRLTQNAIHCPGGTEPLELEKSLCTGFLRSARIEFPLLNIQQINTVCDDDAQLATSLCQELLSDTDEPEIMYRSGSRYRLAIAPRQTKQQFSPKEVFNRDKVFWIVGATSGVGKLLAEHLADHYRPSLVLSGSRKLPPQDQYDDYIRQHDDAASATIKQIRALQGKGADVCYVQLDVRSEDSLRLALDAVQQHHDKVDGVYFSALQLDDRMILQKQWPDYRNMIDMRVNGLQRLVEQAQTLKPEFMVMFSSLAGITGNLGQSDYSASNVYMDHLPYARQQQECRLITVQWGAWELGQQVSDVVREHMQRSGFVHIEAAAGMRALEKIVLSGETSLAYVPGSKDAAHIAESIELLRSGLKSGGNKKIKDSEVTTNSQNESGQIGQGDAERNKMSKSQQTSRQYTGDAQMQLMMDEFNRQREMMMQLCESQNALLASALGGGAMQVSDRIELAECEPQKPAPKSEPVAAETTSMAQTPEIVKPERVEAYMQTDVPAPDPQPEPVQDAADVEAASAPQKKPANLFDYVKSLLARAVEMDVNDIDPDQNIMELGADSMTAMSMVKEMESLYDIELPATLLFEYSTLNELVDFLREEIGEA